MLYRSLASLSLVGLVCNSVATEAHAQKGLKLNGQLEQSLLAQVGRYAVANGRIVYEGGGLHSAGVIGSVPILQIADGSQLLHLTPDGTVAVVQATVSGQTEICRIETDGSGALVPLTAMDEHVVESKMSPDGAWIVFKRYGTSNLYSVPTDGSAPTALVSGTKGSYTYEITADSQRVVFLNAGRQKLHTAPIDGSSPPVRLHPTSVDVDTYQVSLDGSLAVMRADRDDGIHELMAAPTDGSGPLVTLNEPLLGGSTSFFYGVSPDGTSVILAADYGGSGAKTLYRVPGTGGPGVALDTPSANKVFLETTVSPDGERVAYRVRTDDVTELYSVSLDASDAPVRLSADLDPGESVASDFAIDRNSTHVVFRVEVAGFPAGRLYSAPLDGSSPAVALSPVLPLGQGVRSGGYQAGAARVAFLVDAAVPDALELWSAPLDGSAAAMSLHPALAPGHALLDFVLNETGIRAVFRGDKDIDDLVELFIVPLDGSLPPARRSVNRKEPTTVGDVYRHDLSPDGTMAVYHAREEEGDDLYVVSLSGAPERLRLNASAYLVPSSSVLVSPDSTRVVFHDNLRRYSVPADASAAPVDIGSRGTDGRFTPDSSRWVYLDLPGVYNFPERVFSTPLDGSSPPVELNVPRTNDGEIKALEVSSDSARVVYLGAEETAGVDELYSAPTVGGAAPLRLNDALPTGGDVLRMRLCPDASRVVYVADQSADDLLGLYGVPAAGGSAPVPLTILADTSREFADFAISPDSASVVYRAEEIANGQLGLYRVPVDGGAAPTELAQMPAGTEWVPFWIGWTGLRISADSQWVIYDQIHEQPELNGIFSIPLAGGTPVRLAKAATFLAISPDSQAVVYSSDLSHGELFSVPIGGGTARKLNGNFPLSGSLQFDSESRWVLFQSDPVVPGRDDLFAASLAGDVPAFAVGRPLPGSTSGTSGAFRPGTASVVFQAEQDEEGVSELYLLERLTHPPRHLPHGLR